MLNDLQLRFKQAILSEQKEGLDWIAEKPPIDRAERIGIYAYAYFARLTDNLKEDFGIFAQAVGEAEFKALAHEFFSKHPTPRASANEVNRDFPDFLASHPRFQVASGRVDLVRFEWALMEAFYAKDLARTGDAEISQASADDWGSAKLILDPSVQLLCSEWDLVAAIEDPEKRILRQETHLLIHRSEDQAEWQTVSPGQFALLKKLKLRVPLKEASVGLEQEEFGSETFSDWWREGVIRAIEWE